MRSLGWGGGLAAALVLGFIAGLVAVLALPRWAAAPPARATPTVLLQVLPRPTATPTPSPTPVPTATPTPSPTPLAAAGFAVGRFVQVADTGGAGLRFRAQPGLTGQVLFLGRDNEVFRIEQGPVEADGYVWWYLVAPYDATRAGWAAQAFLRPLETTPEP